MSCNNTEIDDGVKEYFKSLSHFKPLKKEEEHELLEAYKKRKDLAARNKLIESNLRYACQLANTYKGRGVPFNELISEANDGLIEAIDRFDINQDVKLISYSRWWIMQKIEKAIDTKNKIPTDDLYDYKEYDDNYYDDDSLSIEQEQNEFIYDSSFYNNINIDELLKTLTSRLSPREKDMIFSYYGINNGQKKMNLDEIGEKYGLTKERVRQIIEKSLLKARSEAMLVDNIYIN